VRVSLTQEFGEEGEMTIQRLLRQPIGLALILAFLMGCSPMDRPAPAPTNAPPSTATLSLAPALAPTLAPADDMHENGLSEEEVATLGSLEQVDDYPLYTMHYTGAYETAMASSGVTERLPNLKSATSQFEWACSLFVALVGPDTMLYGRNFDWEYSPALLLFTDPPDAYASVSMVDIAFLGFQGASASGLTSAPLIERRALLDAPFLAFDGMNERGLVVGMAAVPPGDMRPDPDKETIGSLMVIRAMLDRAMGVDEAVAILRNYNVDMRGGPPIHYLIADASGRSALVEFYQGEMVVIRNKTPWHLATNFLRAAAGDSAEGQCWRYDRISQRLSDAQGRISPQDAMGLLADVAQEGTQWSIVYQMRTGDITVAMGQGYDDVHAFNLSLVGE
jgi:hypothetical protein